MGFTPIDYENWERREYLEFFKTTTIYMTVRLDITALYQNLKERGLRLYPALVYCAAAAVNGSPDFRYGYDAQHNIGLWDELHPYYTVPRKDNRDLFTIKCTPFSADFTEFYARFVQDYAAAENAGSLFGGEDLPPNGCGVSVAPGIEFTAFSFASQKDDLTPFTVFGKFVREQGRLLLPVSGEFAHAVTDGVHIGRFFDALQRAMDGLYGPK